jgi:formate hydrogenlyase subunit 3/multisubunit Na+/H+ antiporter MnhD subunit
MIAEIILVIIALLFLIAAIFLFNGKGKWLIAGYNGLSQKERNKYNEKKVCKAAGLICIVCCGILLAIAYMAYMADLGMISETDMILPALVLLTVLIAAIIVSGLYIGKKGNSKNEK